MLLFTVFQRGDKYTAGSDQLPAVQSSRRVVEHDDILADALLFLLNSGFLTETTWTVRYAKQNGLRTYN